MFQLLSNLYYTRGDSRNAKVYFLSCYVVVHACASNCGRLHFPTMLPKQLLLTQLLFMRKSLWFFMRKLLRWIHIYLLHTILQQLRHT